MSTESVTEGTVVRPATTPARTVAYVGYSTSEGAVVRDCITHALTTFPRRAPSTDEQAAGSILLQGGHK